MPKTKKSEIEVVTPEALRKQLNERWPNSTRMGNDPSLRITRLPTGILSVDYLLGGGFARGRHAELYGDFCITPETRVLTRDMEWVPAGDLDQEDWIVGFDEMLDQGRGKSATFQPSMVLSAGLQKLSCCRVITTEGDLIVSHHHKFVIRRSKDVRGQGRHYWKETHEILPGDLIMTIGGQPWHDDRSYDAGWLAGFLDGEGWRDNARVSAGQLPGVVLDNACRILKERGFDVGVREQGNGVMSVTVRGGKYATWKLLGSIRPLRLLRNAEGFWIGRSISHKGPSYTYEAGVARVLAIEPVGRKEVVPIQTSTGTLVTEGMLSHNSAGKTAVAFRAIAAVQKSGGLASYVDGEHTFDPIWARAQGVKTKKLDLHIQETGETCIDYMQTLLMAGLHDIIVLDSIASLLPAVERSASSEDGTYGTHQARLMSRAMRKLTTVNKNTALIFINQTREAIGIVFGNKNVTSGGKAMGFYAGLRLEFTRIETLKRPGSVIDPKSGVEKTAEIPKGHRVRLTATKDKTGGAKMQDTSTFVYDYDLGGIDPVEDLIYVGRRCGLVGKSGDRWWIDGYEDERQNGRPKFKKWLRKNVLVQEDLAEMINKTIKIQRSSGNGED